VAFLRKREQTAEETLGRLSDGLLRSASGSRIAGGALEIHHPLAPHVDPAALQPLCGAFGVSLSLSLDGPASAGQRVCCESSQLPFQERVFSAVVLHHVVQDGSEAELAEAVRVLRRGGVLLVLGLNRYGWQYRSQDASRRLPGFAPLQLRARLQQLGMVIQGFAGAGLAGRGAPAFMSRGAGTLGLPFADLVLLQARHSDSPEITPLRFRKPRAGVVQSAPMQG